MQEICRVTVEGATQEGVSLFVIGFFVLLVLLGAVSGALVTWLALRT